MTYESCIKSLHTLRVLTVLVNAEKPLTEYDVRTAADLSKPACQGALAVLYREGYAENDIVVGGRRMFYWRITDSGRQECAKLTELFSVVFPDVVQDYPRCQYPTDESKESGIRKFFHYNVTYPTDVEILRKIVEQCSRFVNVNNSHEKLCRRILSCRLHIISDDDTFIIQTIQRRSQKRGMDRHEFVRELFCIHFNIKWVME